MNARAPWNILTINSEGLTDKTQRVTDLMQRFNRLALGEDLLQSMPMSESIL